jgi:hypothetical protein
LYRQAARRNAGTAPVDRDSTQQRSKVRSGIMTFTGRTTGNLPAVSDLHVAFPENRRIVEDLRPASDQGKDSVQLRGEERYRHLVDLCRSIGVVTPEDPYPVWDDDGGPVTIAPPLFLLYDYTFLPPGMSTKEEAPAHTHDTGMVCTEEILLRPDPYPSRDAWCRARLAVTQQRLATRDPDLPTVLVNHFPLVREPTRIPRYPQFAQWCGTRHTADWQTRFNATAAVYGHLHIPRTTWYGGVRFEEVSLGYPREWRRRGATPSPPHQILPYRTGDR